MSLIVYTLPTAFCHSLPSLNVLVIHVSSNVDRTCCNPIPPDIPILGDICMEASCCQSTPISHHMSSIPSRSRHKGTSWEAPCVPQQVSRQIYLSPCLFFFLPMQPRRSRGWLPFLAHAKGPYVRTADVYTHHIFTCIPQ